MARDILGEYGPNSADKQVAKASKGGITSTKDVHAYKPPQGPTSVNNPKSPGLHGDNHDCGSQGKH